MSLLPVKDMHECNSAQCQVCSLDHPVLPNQHTASGSSMKEFVDLHHSLLPSTSHAMSYKRPSNMLDVSHFSSCEKDI